MKLLDLFLSAIWIGVYRKEYLWSWSFSCLSEFLHQENSGTQTAASADYLANFGCAWTDGDGAVLGNLMMKSVLWQCIRK